MVRLTTTLSTLAMLLALLAVVNPPGAVACPFCGGESRSRLTLRMQFAQARVVAFGQLKNPRVDHKTDEGFTDLQVAAFIKDDPVRAGLTTITIPNYLPVVGSAPADFLLFCSAANGKLDPTFGVPASPAVVEYLKAAAKIDGKDPVATLGFFFKHLDSAEPVIATDAFYEFARASDADIARAAKQLDAARIHKLIANPATPAERLGVLAFLLGVSGGEAEAPFLAAMLKENPLSERSSAAFGGLLAGYILLNPKEGWPFATAVLGDAKQSYAVRLSAISAVRFFQSSHGNEYKPEVLRACAALLPHGDFADQAIEDLRRWGYWDLTNEVLSQYAKPSHGAPIVRRSIVRYALSCPDERAKRFVATVRQQDARLVQSVEQTLDLYAPVSNSSTPPKKQP